MPKISVIVPVYKVEKYLKRCVDSILSQTFTDFELILVDDGSPDNCPIMCDEYARRDKRVHVIHQVNGGLSAARNTGIDWAFANSDSEWLTFIDSDDWVHEKYLELLYRAVIETGASVSVCANQRTNGTSVEISENDLNHEVYNTEQFFCKDKVIAIVAWGKLYKKVDFLNIRYPVGRLHEDEFTTYKILFKYPRIAFIDAPLYAYFQNAEGIMRSDWSLKRLSHYYDALEEQIEFFLKNEYKEACRLVTRKYIADIHTIVKKGGYSKAELKEFHFDIERKKRIRVYAIILRFGDPRDEWVLVKIRPVRTKIRIYGRALKNKLQRKK